MRLSILSTSLAVCRLSPLEEIPAWADGPLTSISRTADELSIVCSFAGVPKGIRGEGPFRAIRVAGTLDFALTGILASIAVPLAAAGISIFAISTFDTDYVLVREHDLERAASVLRAAGHLVP